MISDSTKDAIAVLATDFALGEIDLPPSVDVAGAVETWGPMGFEEPTDSLVAAAVEAAVALSARLVLQSEPGPLLVTATS